MDLFVLLAFLAHLALTLASDASVCAKGCQTALSLNSFTGLSSLEDYQLSQCRNALQVKSIFICMRDYCPENEIDKGWISLNHDCEEEGLGDYSLLPWSIIDDVSNAETSSWPVVTFEDTQLGTEFNTSVTIDESLFRLGYQTIYDWDDQTARRVNYGYAMVGYWGLIVLFGFLNNVLRYLIDSSTLRSEGARKLQDSASRFLIVPPLSKNKQVTRFISILSIPRLQGITIAIFIMLNVVLMCVGYRSFENNLYFTYTTSQIWRYIADRAGVMAISIFPVMWLFATRNNFLLWVTGWDFATFNLFHRWIGRVCGLEAFVHGLCVCIYQYNEVGKEYFLTLWLDLDLQMGAVAASSIIVTCLFASAAIRKAVYDLFLIVHQAFAVVILVALWYHLTIDGPDQVYFLWPCVAVWSLDRLGRICRLLIWNNPTLYSSAEYNNEANTIQLKIRARDIISPQPGSYYYIYGWRSLKFWESHPFTLSGWNTVKTAEESYTELIFLISVQKGFTSRLRKQLLKHDESDIDTSSVARKVCMSVEGPYGPKFCPWRSELAVFVIGGAGITIATSFMQQLVDLVKSGRHLETRKSLKIKQVKIIWAIKNPALHAFVYERYISTWESVFAETDIEASLDVYLTSESPTSTGTAGIDDSDVSSSTGIEKGSESSGGDSTKSRTKSSITSFVHGRPVIKEVVRSHFEVLHSSGGKQAALIGCGPQSMAHDIRLAYDECSGVSGVAVDFHLAPFGW